MPQQLIYTSAPRGIAAGRSGHCTVARSAAMREALTLQLEKLSYYQHLSLSGGRERPIYSCRVLDIRGSRYHVLSRIQDAGLDFTGRTNFLAHHLVVTPDEVRQLPSPPVILQHWSGWMHSWSEEPRLLEGENWSALTAQRGGTALPATNWQKLTGEAINGFALLEGRPGIALSVDNLTEEQVLALFAESLELLELRDPRKDYRATAWQYTFTTSMQEQDSPADFRWRCLHSDNPASSRFAGPDCRPISELRVARVTNEEVALARSGRQAPRFLVRPQDVRITEGEPGRLQAQAEGVPAPSYQWFTVDRTGNGQLIANATAAELVIQDPPLGVSRYVVRASNSVGDATSDVVTLSVEQKLRLPRPEPNNASYNAKSPLSSYIKSEDEIERQRNRIQLEQAELMFRKRLRRKKMLSISGATVVCVGLCAAFYIKDLHKRFLAKNDGTNSLAAITATVPSVSETNLGSRTSSSTDSDGENTPSRNELTGYGTRSENPYSIPADWKEISIGCVSNAHAEYHAQDKSPRYDLSAAAAGFAKMGDAAWFVCRTNTTNAFEATFLRADLFPSGSKCGIMVRKSEEPTSAFWFIGTTTKKVVSVWRDNDAEPRYAEEPILQQTGGTAVSFRIERGDGYLVSLYRLRSSDSWRPLGPTNTASRSEPFLSGLAICSGDLSNKVSAHFIVVSP